MPSRTCASIAPRPAVDASVYSRKDWLKSGKAVMGLVVRSVLRRSKASWQSALLWRTASFLVRACRGPAMTAIFFYIFPVIPSGTKERADFGGGFGRQDLPDGREERRVWQEAFLCNPVPQITDLLDGEGALFCPQLKVSVPQSLEDLTEPREMLLPCGGEDNNVVKIKEARFPVETREDAIHEVGEGSRSVAETK